MSWEQRNEAFCKAQTDVQMAYIEAEREVKQLKAENAKLKQELEAVGTAAYLYGRTDLADENAKLKEERDHWHVEQVHAYGNWEDAHKRATELEAENAKLRELVCWMYDCMDVSCAAQYPYSPAPINYNQLMKARARAHELGVEVDG